MARVTSSVPCHPIPHEVPALSLFHPSLFEEFAPTTGNTPETPSTQFVRESEISQRSEGLADDADVACALLALVSHSPRARESRPQQALISFMGVVFVCNTTNLA